MIPKHILYVRLYINTLFNLDTENQLLLFLFLYFIYYIFLLTVKTQGMHCLLRISKKTSFFRDRNTCTSFYKKLKCDPIRYIMDTFILIVSICTE